MNENQQQILGTKQNEQSKQPSHRSSPTNEQRTSQQRRHQSQLAALRRQASSAAIRQWQRRFRYQR